MKEGDKSDACGRNASVYHVYPVNRSTGEERGWKCSKGVLGLDDGAGGEEGGGVGGGLLELRHGWLERY